MAQKIHGAQKVFEIKLQSLYDVEKELEKALPKMAKAAINPELKEGFTKHLAETKEHTKRLEKVFKLLELKPKKLKSEGIRGIIEDGEWVMKVEGVDEYKDAMLASSARYAEHFEMAGYASACEQASLLELTEVEGLLRQTLDEEKQADMILAHLMVEFLETASLEEDEE